MTLGLDHSRHLLARFAFGGSKAEIETYARLPRRRAVQRLFDSHAGKPSSPVPDWTSQAPPSPADRMEMSRKQMRRDARAMTQELKAWWWQEMVATPRPFQEALTLFWHGHFTSESRKVKWAPLMYRQNALLRGGGLGSFADLLRGVARDPAMILYLDNQSNDRRTPNENFARELLELFTLGEGHYTETDIKEAARAFTGWRIRKSTGKFHFARHKHDNGMKRFMGRSGRLGGDDILDTVLANPRVAVWLTERAWRHFVTAEPVREAVETIADRFRASGLQVRVLLEQLALSDAFADAPRGGLVKSPADLLVGTHRLTGKTRARGKTLARAGRRLGQDLFDPPNVKGWPGHTAWIDTASLLARYDLLRRHRDAARELDDSVLFASGQTANRSGGDRLLDPAYQVK